MSVIAAQAITSSASEQLNPVAEFVPSELKWTSVVSDSRDAVLDILCQSTKGNYERIRTWKVTYDVVQKERLTEDYVSKVYGAYLAKDDQTAIVKKHEFTIDVTLDMSSGKVFRDKTTQAISYSKEDSGNPVKLPGSPLDERSIVTSDQFMHFAPGRTWSPPEVAGYPQAKNKPTAFRDSVEKARRGHRGDLVDPRFFFGWSEDDYFWRAFSTVAAGLKGNMGVDVKRQYAEVIEVYEANQPEGKWYRVRINLGNMFATSIWSPANGYYPVSQVLSKGASNEVLLAATLWQWQAVDGIFLPWMVKEMSYSGPNGAINYERQAKVLKCTLNDVLEAHQFDYKALGLSNGDLVVDNMERTVYTIKDLEMVRLAAFGEKYAPPSERVFPYRWLLIGLNAIIVVMILVFIVRKRLSGNV